MKIKEATAISKHPSVNTGNQFKIKSAFETYYKFIVK